MTFLRRPAVLAALFFGLCLASAPALARIGGGQHYGGSRSSHSYSHSSSHSSSFSFGSSHDHSYSSGSTSSSGGTSVGGACCLFLIIALVVGFVIIQKIRQNQNGGGVVDARPVPAQGQLDQWIAGLKQKDPGFDLQALYQKAGGLFVRAQQAWFARDLEPVRPFMSDATYQRFVTQLSLMKAQDQRNAIADPEVLGVELVGVEQNPWFDTVQLSIRARMRDADVPWNTSDADALAAAKKRPAEAFEEIWSFVRKPGAQTKAGQDLFSGKCPNCGAPFKGGAANTCEYCGAVVNSGNYDWTLAEITQSSEAGSALDSVDGVEELRGADPAFSLEMLEDRTSLVFWKWVEAQCDGEARRLAKLATPAGVDAVGAGLRQSGKRVLAGCAVGAVNTQWVAIEADQQRAGVEIRWSANLNGDQALHQSTFVLVRAAGAKTNAGNGMSTARCPSCNAPLTDSLSPTCDYCGAQLSSSQADWVLSSIDDDLG